MENVDLDYDDDENHHPMDASDPSFHVLMNNIERQLSESDVTDDEIKIDVPFFDCVCNSSKVNQDLRHRPNTRPSSSAVRKKYKMKAGVDYAIRPPAGKDPKILRHRRKNVTPPLPPRVTYSIKVQAQLGHK